jgi:hypothetical protein
MPFYILVTRMILAVLTVAGLGLLNDSDSDAKRPEGPSSLNELSMEVTALQALYQFDFTPAQLETLGKIAQETSQPAGVRTEARSSDKFRKVLSELRTALATRKDSQRIQELEEAWGDLRDNENPELDDGWEITEAARIRAPETFRLLSARQLVGYLSSYGNQFTDPHEILVAALGKVRGLSAAQWKEVREAVSEEIARPAAGLNDRKAEQISDKVVQLLIQARVMNDEEFKTQHAELLKSSREILGNPSSLDVIRHSVEYGLAELLSNPRLPNAIAAMSKK